MSLATLLNKKNKEEQKEVIHEEENIEITKKDVLAMIIAALQIIMPIVLLGALLTFLIVILFTKIYI